MEIIHKPYGMDDPYISFPGIERYPRDPLINDEVKINFQATPILGQRAWIEYKREGQIYESRAQFQNNVGDMAEWYGFIPPVKVGTNVEYRIRVGTGKKNSFVSDWFCYTVKEWKEDVFKEQLLFKGNGDKSRINKIEFLTDEKDVYNIRICVKRKNREKFFGLGEHYEDLEITEGVRYVHVFDQYKVQRERAYAPVPFLFSNIGFGMLINTGFRTKWDFSLNDVKIEIDTLGQPLMNKIEIYLWENESMKDSIANIYRISQPKVPPIWVFGPWMSANEWNSQKKIERVVQKTCEYDIPATVLVIEAWSDEQTFYIFNGAEYKEKNGEQAFALEDFNFKEPWPNPKKMIEELTQKNIKLILWQIPVLKYYDQFEKQHKNDVDYALKANYVLKTADGDHYRIPKGRWFENSFVVDFYNEEASKWWASKRKYLVEELGVAGFKTDGGEHLWGRDLISIDSELESTQLRNLYPEKYFETAKSIQKDKLILFSRSGYIHTPNNTLFWVGDEDSEYEALKSNIIAGLNVSLSGNPFWGWDIAGFSGDLPEPDLYNRSCELAVFTPIFQFHSEHPGDPVPSAERSPWNMADYYKNNQIIDNYRFYASLRMNLSPYIFQEAKASVEECRPLTYPVWLDNSNLYDQPLAYFFGRSIIVYPKISKQCDEDKITLPYGTWLSLWEGEWVQSEEEPLYYISKKYHPVFLKKGSIIPLSIDKSKSLGEPHWSQDFNAVLVVDDLERCRKDRDCLKTYLEEIEIIKKEFDKKELMIGFPSKKEKEIIGIEWITL
ncbi:MAG TPA: glycoside hydrolase family 31 protein [Defluviitoga sp.]|nr:glycoside hydrolase family 31 protein [Defluviitoga sp.]